VFAALTNLRTGGSDPSRKSRGQVVMQALEAASASEAAASLGELPPDTYNPFNCFVADAEQAFLVVYEGSPRVLTLSPGVHVVGNEDATALAVGEVAGVDRERAPVAASKTHRVAREALAAVGLPREERLRALESITGRHTGQPACEEGAIQAGDRQRAEDRDPLADTCVHLGDTYGTRSSLLIELADRAEQSRMYSTEGPPCVNQYQDVSSLLHELRQAPGYGAAEILARKAS